MSWNNLKEAFKTSSGLITSFTQYPIRSPSHRKAEMAGTARARDQQDCRPVRRGIWTRLPHAVPSSFAAIFCSRQRGLLVPERIRAEQDGRCG